MVALLLGTLGVVGCTGAQPQGWSGVVVAGDDLFLGSMKGKLVALNVSTGVHLEGFEDYEVTGSSSSGFGCSSTSSAVPIYGTPVATGELVYFGGYNGRVYALNAVSGKRRWVYPTEGTLKPIVGGVVVSGSSLYFGDDDGRLYCLDIESMDEDKKLWDFPTGDKIWATPVVSGDMVFIGSFDKKFYAINAADGSLKWEYPTEGAVVGSPAVDNGTAYFGSFDRHLYAVSADGSLKWQSDFIAGKWFWAGPVISDGMIYAPNLDGKVYIVDAGTGQKIAEPDLGAPISSSPVVIGSMVIVATDNGTVYSIDTGSHQANVVATLSTDAGKEEIVRAPLHAADGVVYIHTQTQPEEGVYALLPETGEILWRIAVK